jgi:hypothetical protein
MLFTNEKLDTPADIEAVVDHYRARSVIEEYFKALKTGCSVEKRQLCTYEGLVRALALFVPVAWALLSLRELGRKPTPRLGQTSLATNNSDCFALSSRSAVDSCRRIPPCVTPCSASQRSAGTSKTTPTPAGNSLAGACEASWSLKRAEAEPGDVINLECARSTRRRGRGLPVQVGSVLRARSTARAAFVGAPCRGRRPSYPPDEPGLAWQRTWRFNSGSRATLRTNVARPELELHAGRARPPGAAFGGSKSWSQHHASTALRVLVDDARRRRRRLRLIYAAASQRDAPGNGTVFHVKPINTLRPY